MLSEAAESFFSLQWIHLSTLLKKTPNLQQLPLFCCITLAAEYVYRCTNYCKVLGWNKLLPMHSSWFWNHNISTIYYYFYKIPKVIRPYCRLLACQRLRFKIKTISELQKCQKQSWSRFVCCFCCSFLKPTPIQQNSCIIKTEARVCVGNCLKTNPPNHAWAEPCMAKIQLRAI